MFEKSQELRVAIERIRITIAAGAPLSAEMLEQCKALVASLGKPEEEAREEGPIPELTQEAVEQKQKAAEDKKGLLKGLIGNGRRKASSARRSCRSSRPRGRRT